MKQVAGIVFTNTTHAEISSMDHLITVYSCHPGMFMNSKTSHVCRHRKPDT